MFDQDDVKDDSDTKGDQNGDVGSKKSHILPIGKSTKRKRSVTSNPKSMKQCKDDVVRRVFDDASKKIKLLQNLTTFENESVRNANPRSCVMFSRMTKLSRNQAILSLISISWTTLSEIFYYPKGWMYNVWVRN